MMEVTRCSTTRSTWGLAPGAAFFISVRASPWARLCTAAAHIHGRPITDETSVSTPICRFIFGVSFAPHRAKKEPDQNEVPVVAGAFAHAAVLLGQQELRDFCLHEEQDEHQQRWDHSKKGLKKKETLLLSFCATSR